MPQNAFFLWICDLLVSQKTTQRHFFFPPAIPFPRFVFFQLQQYCHLYCFAILSLLYTVWSNAYSEIGPEVRCDLSRLLVWKITKRIHSSKPALLNRPLGCHKRNFSMHLRSYGQPKNDAKTLFFLHPPSSFPVVVVVVVVASQF